MKIFFFVIGGLCFLRAGVITISNAVAQRRFRAITGRPYTGNLAPTPLYALLFGIGALIAALVWGNA